MDPSCYTGLFENIVNGNVEGVNKCIKNGTNIYSRTKQMETALYLAIHHGHGQVADILWNIYVNDLQFIESAFKTNIRSTFWIDTPIMIGYGKKNIETFDALYSKYQKCENDGFVNMGKYVMFLLKRDNFKCKQVLMLSPTSREGKMLMCSMIKCVNANGLLDLNAETPEANSLLRACIESGLFKMFDALLNYGAEITNIIEFACYAIEFDRLEYLDVIYNRFKFRFYDWLNSNDYYWAIFKGDKWNVFKYIIEKIIVETGLSWNEVLNLVVPYTNVTPSLTVFEFAVHQRQFKVAEKCLKYISGRGGYKKSFCPIDLLHLDKESKHFVGQMIEVDPSCLDYSSSGKVFFHDIVCAFSLGTVNQLYQKYPVVKLIFFKDHNAAQNTIDRLLANGEFEKIRCVLENSVDHLDMDMLLVIAYKVVKTNCDDLFKYVISVKDFDMARIDTERLIMLAVQNVNLSVFKLVMKSQPDYDLNEVLLTDNSFNLIHILLQQTRDDNVELINSFFDELIECNIGYHIVSSDGKNLLHHSVEYDNYYVTEKLLRLGIDIDRSDEYGKLPVHYVRSVDIYHLLNILSTVGYENVCTAYEKNTLLHICVSSNEDRYDLINHLLDNGANINAINKDGRSPIFYVHDHRTAELISKYQPDLNILDQNGHSPLINFIAQIGHNHKWINLFYDSDKVYKNSEVRKYLGDRCNERKAEDSTFFIEIIRTCDICTNIMLELHCPDLLAKTVLGNNPLHIAAGLKKYDLVDKLIKRGLSLDTINKNGDTPFFVYIQTALAETNPDDGYMKLLKYNPKINRMNKDGVTALSCAIQHFNSHTYDLICELLLRGASLLDVYESDKTAYCMEMAYEAQQIFRFAL